MSTRACPKVCGRPVADTHPAIAWCAATKTSRSPTGQGEVSGLTASFRFRRGVSRFPWPAYGIVRDPIVGFHQSVYPKGLFFEQACYHAEISQVKSTMVEQLTDQQLSVMEVILARQIVDHIADSLSCLRHRFML
ncbi:Uncharacterised protein [Sphingobacterium daejeonense]|nr:Uncharacterised protein [Sphingobacterium daejeonense]